MICMLMINAIVSYHALQVGQHEGWQHGYQMGWYDRLERREQVRHIVCSRYWSQMYAYMLEDKIIRENSYEFQEVYKY